MAAFSVATNAGPTTVSQNGRFNKDWFSSETTARPASKTTVSSVQDMLHDLSVKNPNIEWNNNDLVAHLSERLDAKKDEYLAATQAKSLLSYIALSYKYYPRVSAVMHIGSIASAALYIFYRTLSVNLISPFILVWFFICFAGMSIVLASACKEIDEEKD